MMDRSRNVEDALPPGTRVEEFEIERALQSGGFGMTYLARDRSLERRVAIKEYLPREWGGRRADGSVGPRSSSHADDYRWGLTRFLEEAQTLARLDHPRIVRVYRVIEAWGTAYMVMEYVEGRNLEETLQAEGPWSEERVRGLLDSLLPGLAQVHAAGLIHRDIKPANVMLRGDGTPVLIDFGAARYAAGVHSQSLTSVLTPGYAPQEQYHQAAGQQGAWTDVYALGAVAYRALSGQVPVEAPRRVEAAARRQSDPLAPVAEVASGGVSEVFGQAVSSALAVFSEDRPQDVSAWRAQWGPEPLPPPSPARARPGLLLAGLAGLLLAAAVAVGLVVIGSRSDDAPPAGGRVADSTPVVPPEAEEAELGLNRTGWLEIQKGLMALGLDPGTLDGRVGGGTRRAVRAYQEGAGKVATGFVDAADVTTLRAAASEADRVAEQRRAEAAEAERRRTEAAEAERRRAEAAEAERRRAEAAAAEAAAAERRRLEEWRRSGRVFRDCDTCPEMVVIPAGTFMMGSPASEAGRFDDEGPRHRVTLRSFALGVTEVTFDEWDACVRGGGCNGYRPGDEGWGRGARPVINVSWQDAQAYVSWLSEITSAQYRLPSESEWEYAARGSTTTSRYWGNGSSAQCAHGNGADASAKRVYSDWTVLSCDDGVVHTASVGSYGANAFGLFDVLGNVWEWTADCWHGTYAGAPGDGSAWTRGGNCGRRVLRGGSWLNLPRYLRSAARNRSATGARPDNAGFRVSRTLD